MYSRVSRVVILWKINKMQTSWIFYFFTISFCWLNFLYVAQILFFFLVSIIIHTNWNMWKNGNLWNAFSIHEEIIIILLLLYGYMFKNNNLDLLWTLFSYHSRNIFNLWYLKDIFMNPFHLIWYQVIDYLRSNLI